MSETPAGSVAKPEIAGEGIEIVIPTLGRESVLVETLGLVRGLGPRRVILVDQTPEHEPGTRDFLEAAEREGWIEWLRLCEPNIPAAMNAGLLAAKSRRVLFLDDDIIPSADLLSAHLEAHAGNPDAWAVVGQVLQPGEKPVTLSPGEGFRFNSDRPAWIESAMAGNLSVDRERALGMGGFDENFVGAAYMFEAEFASRVRDAGGKVYFEPRASLRHLRAERGGTRAHGHHLTTASPSHSAGAHYYFLLRNPSGSALARSCARVLRSVRTRHHLLRPWLIPVGLLAEIRGFFLARRLFSRGPRLLRRG